MRTISGVGGRWINRSYGGLFSRNLDGASSEPSSGTASRLMKNTDTSTSGGVCISWMILLEKSRTWCTLGYFTFNSEHEPTIEI